MNLVHAVPKYAFILSLENQSTSNDGGWRPQSLQLLLHPPDPASFSYLENQIRSDQLMAIFSYVTLSPSKVVRQEGQAC